MAKRVMNLLWTMMMNPEAPQEVSKSPAMTDALAAYAQRKVAVDRQVACEYIRQCVAQIEADSSVAAAMSLLQRLMHLSVGTPRPTKEQKAAHPRNLKSRRKALRVALACLTVTTSFAYHWPTQEREEILPQQILISTRFKI